VLNTISQVFENHILRQKQQAFFVRQKLSEIVLVCLYYQILLKIQALYIIKEKKIFFPSILITHLVHNSNVNYLSDFGFHFRKLC